MRKTCNNSWHTYRIVGEPASKSNSRKLVLVGGKPRIIKSRKALDYEGNFALQARRHDPLFDEDVILGVRVWYKTRRPDLDISHVKDCLQGYSYVNDRSVKVEHAVWSLDRVAPRAYIVVAPVADALDVIHHLHEDVADYGTRFGPNG